MLLYAIERVAQTDSGRSGRKYANVVTLPQHTTTILDKRKYVWVIPSQTYMYMYILYIYVLYICYIICIGKYYIIECAMKSKLIWSKRATLREFYIL